MFECLRCGSHVSMRYVRVSVPSGRRRPLTCPHCTDAKSEGRRQLTNLEEVDDGVDEISDQLTKKFDQEKDQ